MRDPGNAIDKLFQVAIFIGHSENHRAIAVTIIAAIKR
jgi:hypothetical protein